MNLLKKNLDINPRFDKNENPGLHRPGFFYGHILTFIIVDAMSVRIILICEILLELKTDTSVRKTIL